MQIACYDQEIITKIVQRTSLPEPYVQQITENRPILSFPIHVGRSFYSMANPVLQQNYELYQEQKKILLEMSEKSDCVIIGRCADHILAEKKPFRIFVYADLESKMKRCRMKADEHEHLSDKELRQYIMKIDRNRYKRCGACAGKAVLLKKGGILLPFFSARTILPGNIIGTDVLGQILFGNISVVVQIPGFIWFAVLFHYEPSFHEQYLLISENYA